MSTTPKEIAAQGDANGTPNPTVQRALVFVVAFLGLLIVAGLTAVIARVMYLSSRGPAQLQQSEAASGASVPGQAHWKVLLPQGATVRSTALGGNRMAVHYDAPSGAGVIVVDLGTGAATARVDFAHEPDGK